MNRLVFFAAMAFAISQGSYAQDSLSIEHVWARSTPSSSQNGAVYLTIHNQGTQADRLLSAQTPQAARTQLHRSKMNNGVMQMREEVGGVALAAGQTVTFAPGGLHVMLMGLAQPLKSGTHFPLTLHFDKAGERRVEVEVQDSPGNSHATMHGHMDHSN
jgi:copper(I)-binding protein